MWLIPWSGRRDDARWDEIGRCREEREEKIKDFARTIVDPIVSPDGVADWREPDTLEEYRPGCASFAARSLRNFT